MHPLTNETHVKLALWSLLATTLTFSNSVQALECPRAHTEYNQLLSQLKTFEEQLKQKPECQNIAHALSDLSVFYQSENHALIAKALQSASRSADATKPEFPVEDLAKLQNYTQSVTEKLSSIVGSLNNQPQCKEATPPSVLSTLSTITGEVTKVASTFSGPYAVPISVGGGLVAGILSGIDALIESRRGAYDFKNDGEARRVYLSNVCVFHDIREEINSILLPKRRQQILAELSRNLEIKREKLVLDSELSKQYYEVYLVAQRMKPHLNEAEQELNHLKLNMTTLDSYESCERLAFLAYNERSAFLRALKKYNGPFAEHSEHVWMDLEAARARDYEILNYEQCLSSNLNPNARTLDEVNRRSLNRMKHLISEISRHIEEESNRLHGLGSDEVKRSGSHRETNFVDWMRQTLLKQEWANSEILRFSELVKPGSEGKRLELQRLKKNIEDRFALELEPKYLEYRIKEAEKATKTLSLSKRKTISFIRKLQSFTSNPELGRTSQLFDHAFTYYELSQLLDQYQTLVITTDLLVNRCTYFAKANMYSNEVRRQCESRDSAKLKVAREEYRKIFEAIESYLSWCHRNNIIEMNNIEAILEKIAACHQTIGKGN